MHSSAAAEWRKGWPVVFAALVGSAGISLHVISLGPLLQFIQEDTGWSRQQIVLGFTIASFVAIVLQPIAGFLVDRIGARRFAVPGLALYGLSLGCLSLVGSDISSWLFFWVLIALASSSILSVWITGVAGHFNRARGMATSVSSLGSTLVGVALPFITTMLAREFGWRGAYLGLAAFPLCVALPIVAGLFTDARFARGSGPPAAARRRAVPARATPLDGKSVHQILQSRNFWQMSLASLLLSSGGAGLTIHFVPIIVQIGPPLETAAALVGWVGVGGFVGRIGGGYLLDRFDARFIAVGLLFAGVLAVVLLMGAFNNLTVLSLALLLMGLSLGAQGGCLAYLMGQYFGIRNFGFAFGGLTAASAFGAGIGPLIGGAMYDRFQNYWFFEVGLVSVFGLAALLLLALGPYPSTLYSVEPERSINLDGLGQTQTAESPE